MERSPTWQSFVPQNPYPTLRENLKTDVIVVGGGIAGILCCYKLIKAGYDVVLLEEQEDLCQGATLYTTAFLTQVIDTDLGEQRSIYGDHRARLIWQSHGQAIDEIERIIMREQIECDFKRCPNFIFASTKTQGIALARQSVHYRELGFSGRFIEQGGPAINHYGCFEVPRQAKFNPIQFCFGVAQAAFAAGAQIFTNSKVIELRGEGPVVAQTRYGAVVAQHVIMATYRPLFQEGTRFKKGMYKTYMFEVEIPKDALPEAIYEDLSNPYYYFRVYNSGKKGMIILGGEDHRIELKLDERKSFASLKRFLEKILSGRPYTITRRWTGPILEPADGLALIGQISPHYYVATAFSGNGMTYAAIAAQLLTDLISISANPYIDLYDPRRVPTPKQLLCKGRDYTQELLTGVRRNISSKKRI